MAPITVRPRTGLLCVRRSPREPGRTRPTRVVSVAPVPPLAGSVGLRNWCVQRARPLRHARNCALHGAAPAREIRSARAAAAKPPASSTATSARQLRDRHRAKWIAIGHAEHIVMRNGCLLQADSELFEETPCAHEHDASLGGRCHATAAPDEQRLLRGRSRERRWPASRRAGTRATLEPPRSRCHRSRSR